MAVFAGIVVSAGNGKTGKSFSLPNVVCCPGATDLCISVCYVSEGTMNFRQGREFRDRNFYWVREALKAGTFAAELTAAIARVKTKTIRIHDSGDFFSPVYIRGWIETIKANPDIRFWAYTRSWRVAALMPALAELALLPNMALWLSADAECWTACLATYKSHKALSGIAFMQTEDTEDIATILANQLPAAEFVNFPYHRPHRTEAKPNGVQVRELDIPNCPAVTGEIKHDKKAPACLACNKCLPVEATPEINILAAVKGKRKVLTTSVA